MVLKSDHLIYHIFRAFRPRQWIKNLIIFAPIIFSGELFNAEIFWKGVSAFVFFSVIASGVYLVNDLKDIEKDKLHPVKKNRPIASGKLPIKLATILAVCIFLVFLPLSFVNVGKYFGIVLCIYVLLQMAYNLKLKDVIIVDALTISLGFILRAFAGALAIPLSISSWLILAITGASLLLAFGKRRAERTLLEAQGISRESTRTILKHYPDNLLDSMISMSASFSIITYALFAFQTSPDNPFQGEFGKFLPSTLAGPKLLMLTIPIVIYGVARYLYVIYEKKEGESPERVLLNDKPLLFSVVLMTIIIVLITNILPLFAETVVI
ncbi:MAG: Decaprenyl-phosphate phosphoribosyltransferase [Patescibacteria group bacterium]|nr:Decaprenyl-phosphate phosphoribosyltransferase [Patescibacteria group bacterium]